MPVSCKHSCEQPLSLLSSFQPLRLLFLLCSLKHCVTCLFRAQELGERHGLGFPGPEIPPRLHIQDTQGLSPSCSEAWALGCPCGIFLGMKHPSRIGSVLAGLPRFAGRAGRAREAGPCRSSRAALGPGFGGPWAPLFAPHQTLLGLLSAARGAGSCLCLSLAVWETRQEADP